MTMVTSELAGDYAVVCNTRMLGIKNKEGEALLPAKKTGNNIHCLKSTAHS